MDKRVHAFLKGISSKVNIVTLLEFELHYCDIAVQYVSHCAMETPPMNRMIDKEIDRYEQNEIDR